MSLNAQGAEHTTIPVRLRRPHPTGEITPNPAAEALNLRFWQSCRDTSKWGGRVGEPDTWESFLRVREGVLQFEVAVRAVRVTAIHLSWMLCSIFANSLFRRWCSKTGCPEYDCLYHRCMHTGRGDLERLRRRHPERHNMHNGL